MKEKEGEIPESLAVRNMPPSSRSFCRVTIIESFDERSGMIARLRAFLKRSSDGRKGTERISRKSTN